MRRRERRSRAHACGSLLHLLMIVVFAAECGFELRQTVALRRSAMHGCHLATTQHRQRH